MTGTVYLVGAGPGDPGLITLRGLTLLRAADAVVYDRLIPPELLAEIRPDAERRYVGRARGSQALSQAEVNALLVRLAQEWSIVVRLKGGDPFVFGRGGEEADACAAAGVPCEVVPGVTSAVAVPAYAGIPLTHREVASSFAVITGHEDPAQPGSRIDWARFATGIDTLVVLMGMEQLPGIVQKLLAHGRPPGTPAAVISRGTRLDQRTVVGRLDEIAAAAQAARLQAPAVAIVGDVVRLRSHLAWFDRRPLFGRRVLVARAREQASDLTARLQALGAQVLEAPHFQVEPAAGAQLEAALDRLPAYDWLLFTSASAVHVFWAALTDRGQDTRALGRTRVGAAGPGTVDALAGHGVRADFETRAYLADEVAAAFRAQATAGSRVLLVRGADTLTGLGPELAASASMDDVVAYRLVLATTEADRAAILAAPLDAVVFPSSGSVRQLTTLLGDARSLLASTAVACIGPTTVHAAQEQGLRVDATAANPSIQALIDAVLSLLAPQLPEA